jgi:hypothetical protein
MYLFEYDRCCLRSICWVLKKEEEKQEDQFVESQRGALDKFFAVSCNAQVSQDQG